MLEFTSLYNNNVGVDGAWRRENTVDIIMTRR